MEKALNQSIHLSGPAMPVYKNVFVEYQPLMHELFDSVKKFPPFVTAGKFELKPDWILYISVVKDELTECIKLLSPLFHTYPIAIAVPENSNIASHLLDGTLGVEHAGKLVAIQGQSNELLNDLAMQLVKLTGHLEGPSIPSAYFLGSRVYAQFELPLFSQGGTNRFTEYEPIKNWPFKSFKQVQSKSSKRLGQYLLVKKLKHDVKGSVYKALFVKNWFAVKWCVIKEGVSFQSRDEFGRDVTHRLNWQAQIHKRLEDFEVLPRMYDLFEKENNTYLAMEYIEGSPYHQRISEVQEGLIFSALTIDKQLSLLHWAAELVRVVSLFHQQGLLHRDLTPLNFIVESSGRLKAIDVELAYDMHQRIPAPWFSLGTEGYMSPQQRRLEYPVIEDDIYGLGGILIFTFTGLSPAKFEKLATDESLFDHLYYFIGEQRLASILASCRSHNASVRPDLSAIEHTLDLLRSKLILKSGIKPGIVYKRVKDVPEIVSRSVASFTGLKVDSFSLNQLNKESINYSFGEGIAGLLYVMSRTEATNYDLALSNETYSLLHNSVIDEIKKAQPFQDLGPGLTDGTAGIAITLAEMISLGVLENKIQYINAISQLLDRSNPDLSMSSGIAGQGLARLVVAKLLNFQNFTKPIPDLLDGLVKCQNKDGSWDADIAIAGKKGIQATGLFHGVAGISYFILSANQQFNDPRYEDSAKRALKWLISQIKNDDQCTIAVNTVSYAADPWLEHGFTGVAFTLLKAYEYSRTVDYKNAASKLLMRHPKQITSNYIGFYNGLAGLGEVYLEAHRILGENEWIERSDQIGSFFLHTSSSTINKQWYWLEGNEHKPSPGFNSGNAGILHFLMRLSNPSILNFPLIDNRS